MTRSNRRRAARAWPAAACLCAAALAGLGGCDISRPTIRLQDIEVHSIDFEKIELTYHFEITNPNSYRITLWGFDFALVAGGQTFARCTLPKPVGGVPTGGQTTVRAPVTLKYADVPLVVSRPDKPSFYGLDGSAAFSFMGTRRSYPFTHAGLLPPLRQPKWRFVKLRLANRDEGIIELSFDVENPNTFALPMGRLTGTLRGGAEALLPVDRAAPGSVPPGKTARLVLPAKLAPDQALRVAARAEAAPQSLQFEGGLELRPPPELRPMLLGREDRP